MKRFFAYLLLITILFIFYACTASNNGSDVTNKSPVKEKVEITAENFKEYFEVKPVTDYINVNKKGGYNVLGVYVPEYFTADAAFTVKIYPIKTFEIDSVSVDLHVFDYGSYFDIDKNVTVNISAVGETSTNQFTTSTKKNYYDEHFFDGLEFGSIVEGASGTISIDKN